MVESKTSAFFMITLYTSSEIRGAFSFVLGSMYSYKSLTVSEKDFLVFLCRLETAILEASKA